MGDLQTDPAVIKLLEYAKEKKSVSYEEVTDFLPDSIVNSDKIDEVIGILEKHQITLEEEDTSLEEDKEDKKAITPKAKKRIVYTDKDTAIDDPIRLYLREIGKENLLTAEQEVKLSKQMEDGENIIKKIIKESGMIIPEVFEFMQRTYSKLDPADLAITKKEVSELLAERRRLNHQYKEQLRDLINPLKQYIDTKKKAIALGGDIFTDESKDK